MTTMVSELYQALKAAGVDDDIARAAAKSVIAFEDKEQLATKADIASLQFATKTDIAALQSATKTDIAALKADVEALRLATKADLSVAIANLKSDLSRTLVTTMLGMTAIFSLIVTIAVRFLR